MIGLVSSVNQIDPPLMICRDTKGTTNQGSLPLIEIFAVQIKHLHAQVAPVTDIDPFMKDGNAVGKVEFTVLAAGASPFAKVLPGT